MENHINDLTKKYAKRKLLERILAVLCVCVMLLTVNGLKQMADTLSRVPMCGLKEHHHTDQCYDDGGNLVCGKAEHEHTDACYQQRPSDQAMNDYLEVEADDADLVVEDSADLQGELSLDGISLDDSLLDDSSAAQNHASAAAAASSLVKTPEYKLGSGAMLSKIIEETGLEIEFGKITDVGVVDTDGTQAALLYIEKDESDYKIRAAKDFAWVDLGIVLSGEVVVVRLTEGATEEETEVGNDAQEVGSGSEEPQQEGSSEPAVEGQSETNPESQGDADAEDQGEPNLEDQGEPNLEDQGEPNLEDQGEPNLEDQGKPVVEDQGEPVIDLPANLDLVLEDNTTIEAPVTTDEEEPGQPVVGGEAGSTDDEQGDEPVAGESGNTDADEQGDGLIQTAGDESEAIAADEQGDENAPADEQGDENAAVDEQGDITVVDPDQSADEEQQGEDGTSADDQGDGQSADGQDENATDDQQEEAASADGQSTAEEAGDEPVAGESGDASDEEQSDEDGAPAGEQQGEEAADNQTADGEGDAAEDEQAAENEGDAAENEQAAENEGDAAENEQADENEGDAAEDEQAAENEGDAAEDEQTAEGEGDIPEDEETADAQDEDAAEEQSDDEAAGALTATIDLAEVDTYPLSLCSMIADALQSSEAEANSAPLDEWAIEYDQEMLTVEAAEDDYLITPVASFDSTVIAVENGIRYEFTLINYIQPEEPAPEADEAEGAEEGDQPAEILYPAQSFTGSAGNVTVNVTAPEGAFPEGTTMIVKAVHDSDTINGICDTVNDDFTEVKSVQAVDISFWFNENEIEPLLPINVVMSVPEIAEDQSSVVVHVDDEGGTSVVDTSDASEVAMEMPATSDPEGVQSAINSAVEASETTEESDTAEGSEAAEEPGEQPPTQDVEFESQEFSVYAYVVTETIETHYIDAEGKNWKITVGYGQEALIPTGASLAVSEVTGADADEYLAQTAERLSDETITMARFFDITILDKDGNEVQPVEPVEVRVELDDGSEDTVKAVHFADEGEMQVLTAEQDDGAVSFEARSFSVYGIVYTVDFHWSANGETFDYSIPGGDCASLRDLLGLLNVIRDDPETVEDEAEAFMAAIADVTFSNPELLAVHKVEENTTVGALRVALGVESEYSAALTEEERETIDARELTAPDWALFSLKPFTTDETLTVAMTNGDSFAIAVTDAQIATRVIAADGTAYKITLTFGPEAEIPLDAQLRVTEIEQGSEEYYTYLAQAKIAVNGQPDGETSFARFFDIEIHADEQTIEPKASVLVKIELADAPEDEKLAVVHFEQTSSEEVPVLMDAEVDEDIRFVTESFSVYGVIAEPAPSGVDGLDGYSVKISNNGWYLGSANINGNPRGISKTQNSSDAAVWTFESAGNNGVYNIYTMVDGQKQYIHITSFNGQQGNAFLSSEPQALTVSQYGNNNYVIGRYDNGNTYYINHWGSGSDNRFCAYAYYDSPDARLTFTFASPIIKDGGEYAVIVEYNGGYYVVQNDGSLVPVQYSVEDNVAYVNMENPVFWSYVQENGKWNLRIRSQAATFDGQNLPNRFYYKYIDPNTPDGITEERNIAPDPRYPAPKYDGYNYKESGYDYVVNNLGTHHGQYVNNCAINEFTGNKIQGNSGYIGIDGSTMKIKGGVPVDQAATVYFAQVENIPQSANLNNTVNHIDISIEGGASLSVPLAYGTYYYYVGGERRTLTVPEGEDKTLNLKVDRIPIDSEDMKQSEVTAYSDKNGILDNAFYITGYTQNHGNSVSTPQIRLEGSFKVSDLEHSYADYKLENGEWFALNDWEKDHRSEDNLSAEELTARKNNRVYYTVTVKKELDFPWMYEYETGQTAQLYDAQTDQPLSTTRMVNLSKSFDYWDMDNECPPIKEVNGGADIPKWQAGHILWDTSAHNGSGMDFTLQADMNDVNADVVALEITKYLRKNTWDGEVLHSATPITNQFIVYEKLPSNQADWDSVVDVAIGLDNGKVADYSGYSGLHGKSITVGASGEGMVYDYDLGIDGTENKKAGMYYIKENENSIPKIIIAQDGTRWMYISTKTETEYVWRGYADNEKPSRHSVDGLTSIPEVAGLYGTYYDSVTQKNENLFNGFLTFYVYNVYAQTGYLKINKAVTYNGESLAGSDSAEKKEALAGTYTFTVYTDEQCSEAYMVTQGFGANQTEVPLQLTIEILADGQTRSSDLVELPVGTYWIMEETPANGSITPEENPLQVEVTAANTTEQPAEVTFTNNKIDSNNPDELAIELEKTFTGLPNASKIPAGYHAALVYKLNNETVEVPLTGVSHENVTCTKSADGMTWHWRVVQIPTAATNFGVKESNYDIPGYTRITKINGTEVANPGTTTTVPVQVPTINLTQQVDNYQTTDSTKTFEITGNEILLVRLTKNDGTMVVSQKSLSYSTRKAIEEAIPHISDYTTDDPNARWKMPAVYFSHEIQGDSYSYDGLTVYFSGNLVTVPHKSSSHELEFLVTYVTETAANSFTIENIYTETPLTVDILKIEEGNSAKPLEGAVFELRQLQDVAPTNGEMHYVKNGDNEDIVFTKISGENGKLSFDGLTHGFYEIKEVTPPPEYILTEEIVFYLKVDGGVISCIAKQENKKPSEWLVTSLTDPLQFTAATANTNPLITVGNTPTGNLKLTKVVEDTTDTSKDFTFNVTLTAGGTFETLKNDSPSGTQTVVSGTAFTVTLKAGESWQINGLPVGTTWTVTENSVAGYTLKNGTIASDGEAIVQSSTVELTATNVYEASTSFIPKVKKVFTNGVFTADNPFTFILTEVNDANSTNAKENTTPQTVPVSNGNAVAFTGFTYDQTIFDGMESRAKTFFYTIVEDIPEKATEANGYIDPDTGIRYDPSVHRITVTVTDVGDGTLSKVITLDDKPVTETQVEVEFTNEQLGKLTVTKNVELNGAPDGTERSFWVAVYSDAGADATTRVAGPVEIVISNSGSGTAVFDNLPVGTYYVYELTGQDGDPITGTSGTIDGVDYVVTTDNTNAKIEVNSTTGVTDGTATITNNHYTVDLNILKVDSVNQDKTLTGAKFKILRRDLGSTGSYAVFTNSSVTFEQNANGQNTGIVEVDTNGEIALTSLLPGEYEVSEEKSPDGYLITQKTFHFTIQANGEVEYTDSSNGVITYNDAQYQFTVRNQAGSRLPDTGGPGTTLYYAAGAALLLLAAVLLIRKKAKE